MPRVMELKGHSDADRRMVFPCSVQSLIHHIFTYKVLAAYKGLEI